MKKALPLLLIFLAAAHISFAQNVGIGNTSPLARLDLNGDLALRSADLNITSTYTYALDVNTIKQSSYKLKAAPLLSNFILAGITAGIDGRIITLTNRTVSSMEIYNEDATANANDRIQTGTGGTLAVYPNGSVTLQYDVPEQRWLVKAGHNNSLNYFGGGGGGTSYWDLNGTNIYNNNSGNVGIGVSNPNFKLDINGDQRIIGTAITTPGFNGGLTSGGILHVENASNKLSLKIDGSGLQAEKPKLNLIAGTNASNLLLNPFGGNVGIGTGSTATLYSPLSFNSSVLGKRISLWNDGMANDYGMGMQSGEMQFYAGFPESIISFGWGSSTPANYNRAIVFKPGTAQVGINCLPKAGYNLAVDGKIKAKEIVVELAGWADYVFDEDYQLPTLESVAQHIKDKKHLPGIPSAATIQKDGLSIGAVQTKMMEKIEELTLYVIELKREIALLKGKK